MCTAQLCTHLLSLYTVCFVYSHATCLVQQDFLNIHGATLSRVTRCVRCTKLHCWDLYYVYNTCTYRSSNKDTLYTSVYVRLHLVLVGKKRRKRKKLWFVWKVSARCPTGKGGVQCAKKGKKLKCSVCPVPQGRVEFSVQKKGKKEKKT